jgi:hypothetical protein
LGSLDAGFARGTSAGAGAPTDSVLRPQLKTLETVTNCRLAALKTLRDFGNSGSAVHERRQMRSVD